MRLLSLLCLLLVASVASATHPVQIRDVVVQRQYVAPVVQQLAVDDCHPAQAFAVQQFYAAPLRVQAVQSYGYGVQQVQAVHVQRVQAVQQIQRVQVQRIRVVQPVQQQVIQRSVTRTRTVIR